MYQDLIIFGQFQTKIVTVPGGRTAIDNDPADKVFNFFFEKMCDWGSACGCVRRTLQFLCNVRAGAGQNRGTLKVCS